MKMKKYLMTGIAALALCAGFTSCSHDLEPMSQEEIDNLEAQKIVDNYKAAFEQYIGGKVASTQNWGFGVTSTRTRGNANTNANEWGSTYNVPVELTQGQKDRVRAYFQHNQLTDGGTKNWSEFFIQQVYEGGTNPLVKRGQQNPNNYSTEEYQAANGSWFDAGDQMDYLVVNNNPEHINNFNSAHGSMNNNVLNTPNVQYLTDNGNGYHSDEIQLMVESKATAFGFHNSQASVPYYDHYTMVDGSVIDEWADEWAELHGETFGASVTGRYFVGLDFDMLRPEDCWSTTTISASEWKSGINHIWSKNDEGEDVFTEWDGAGDPLTDALGNTIYRLKDNTNKYHAVDKVNLNDGDIIKDMSGGNQAFNKEVIDDLISRGYRPTSSNFREWIKVGSCRDYYYSDWIICIAPATPENNTNANLRIMAEDLTLGDGDEDFDFNDVVFDVYYGTPETGKIKIKAAGATLDLRIAKVANPNDNNPDDWYEVHKLFQDANPGTSCGGKMINTNGTHSADANVRSKSLDGLVEPEIPLPFEVTDAAAANNIIIETHKGNQWIKLTAHEGEPAAKFAIPAPTPDTTVNWMNERVSIKGSCPTFAEWARTGRLDFKWW
jgi:hypothetical protein